MSAPKRKKTLMNKANELPNEESAYVY